MWQYCVGFVRKVAQIESVEGVGGVGGRRAKLSRGFDNRIWYQ